MIELLCFCLCSSFAITGIHIAITREGMILFLVSEFCRFWPSVITKPLYDCMICMASVWTTLFYIFYTWGEMLNLSKLLFAVLIVAGINTLICALLEKLSDYGC